MAGPSSAFFMAELKMGNMGLTQQHRQPGLTAFLFIDG